MEEGEGWGGGEGKRGGGKGGGGGEGKRGGGGKRRVKNTTALLSIPQCVLHIERVLDPLVTKA